MPIQKGLGKGLGSLIPSKKSSANTSGAAPAAKSFGIPLASTVGDGHAQNKKQHTQGVLYNGSMSVPLKNITANPYQPREQFTEQAIEELVSSVKRHGILQPLVVVKKDLENYELIAGERRLRAAELAGLQEVPVVLHTAVDAEQQLELAVIENVQRADLNPIEEAIAYKRMMEEFGLTQDTVAAKIGKSRAKVANSIRLLNLPQPIQDALKFGKITEGHGKILAGLATEAEQMRVFQQITTHGLSVAETAQHTGKRIAVAGHTRSSTKTPELRAEEKELERVLGTKVIFQDAKGKGRCVIEYYSSEERKAIVEKITKSHSS